MLNKQGAIVALGLVLTLGTGRAEALPGQTIKEVAAWIQAHPTLLPASGEREGRRYAY